MFRSHDVTTPVSATVATIVVGVYGLLFSVNAFGMNLLF